MPDPTPNRSLWEVMHDANVDASMKHDGHTVYVYAAELRAIAGEVIKAAREADIDQDARNWLYRWLRTEADRAEAGH